MQRLPKLSPGRKKSHDLARFMKFYQIFHNEKYGNFSLFKGLGRVDLKLRFSRLSSKINFSKASIIKMAKKEILDSYVFQFILM